MPKKIAKEKSKEFALRIIKLYKYLTETQKEFIIAKQVVRSGTSIGANIAEAECAISKSDFLSKIYIALKEASETQYWLELLQESDYITKSEFDSIYTDCNEITKILVQTTKTIKNNTK